MKLNQQHKREGRPKAVVVLNPELSEPDLNTQIGLPVALEKHLRQFLETRPEQFRSIANQLETAVGLITLFPKEAEHFRQLAPVDLALSRLSESVDKPTRDVTLRALEAIRHLAPEKCPPFGQQTGEHYLQYLQGVGDHAVNEKLELAVQLISIFPALAEKIRQAVAGVLQALRTEELDLPLATGTDLWIMYHALSLDPTLHSRFKEFILRHQVQYDQFFENVRKFGKQNESCSIARWYATYKLLLAEEITLSPTGILLAVEKPVIARSQPLPDRPLAV